MRTFLICCAVVVVPCLAPDALSAREWADITGKFRVEAEYVSVRGDKVILEKTDKSVVAVPIEKLCQADRNYIQQQIAPTPTPSPAATVPMTIAPSTNAPSSASAPVIPPADTVPLTNDKLQLAQKTRELLTNACYRCHGEDGVSEGGFNFAINLEKLARTMAKPKDVSGSLLLQRITAKDDGVMPPVGEVPRPSAAELATIKAWIEAGSPSISDQPKRPFITNEKVVTTINEDVNKQAERSRRFMRYFTLTHLYNASVSEDELQTYRNAFAKLINSLSWNTDMVIPRPIDEARTVMAIDIRDLHWTSEMWDSIEESNPYFLRLTTPSAIACEEATQTTMPYVRIDWFVFAASKPPLYHSLLNLPESDIALEDLLRVRVQANIDQEQAIRAAFNRSGVSQNNRLIEWHKSPYGSYWKSYDFGGSIGRQNLFQYPLGPFGDAVNAFKHDGGEIIFSLPNGLQGYLLVDDAGNRIDQGPTSIVSDPKRPDKTVTNGVSCMSCHYTGVIPKRDEVGDAVRANRNAFADAEEILSLYREESELENVFARDGERFANSLKELGISNLSRSGEPISAMASRFDDEIDLGQVACEFGLSTSEFQDRLSKATTVSRAFSSLLIPGGTIKRDVFLSMFNEASVDLRLTVEADINVNITMRGDQRKSLPTNSTKTRRNGNDAADAGVAGPEVARFRDLTWGVSAIALSPDGKFVAAGKPDRGLLLFDVANQATAGSLENLEVLQGIECCEFTPDGKLLVVGGRSGHIAVYSVSGEGLLREHSQFAGHSNEITSLAVSSDSRFAMSGGGDKKACYWEIKTGDEIATIDRFKGAVKAVHIASNTRALQATDGETWIEFDPNRNVIKRQRPLTNSWAAGQSAAFSVKGDLVAAGDSYNIRVWNTETGREQPQFAGEEIQWSMRFTPDGTKLISGGNGKVNIWDIKKHQRVYVQATSGIGYVQTLAISGNSKLFAAPGSSARDLQVFRFTK